MARPRTIPDADIFAAIRRLLTEQGEKGVAFGSVARLTGLAAATLVQRYANRDGMIRAALLAGFADLHTATAAADAREQSAQALLKSLAAPAAAMTDPALMAVVLRDATLRAAAADWRHQVESALSRRIGTGDKSTDAAALLFAAWQGRLLWMDAGGSGFRLKDAARRIT